MVSGKISRDSLKCVLNMYCRGGHRDLRKRHGRQFRRVPKRYHSTAFRRARTLQTSVWHSGKHRCCDSKQSASSAHIAASLEPYTVACRTPEIPNLPLALSYHYKPGKQETLGRVDGAGKPKHTHTHARARAHTHTHGKMRHFWRTCTRTQNKTGS